MINNLTLRLLLLSTTFICLNTIAHPQPAPIEAIPAGPVKLSDNLESRTRTWTGIGRLRGDNTSFCTATLIDTRGNIPSETAPAYIVTSQRCLNTKNFGQYVYTGGIQQNVPILGAVYFNNFYNRLGQLKTYELSEVAWQSDEGLNIAIIKLSAPLSRLMAEGIHPLKVADRIPSEGTEILTLGIPEFENLQAAHCTQLAVTDIASHPWVSTNLLKNRCSNLKPGAEGGPVVSKTGNELISVLVASTHDAEAKNKCLANAPCELAGSESVWSPESYYTRPVSFLNQCFINGVLNADSPACDLHLLSSVNIAEDQRPPARITETLPTEAALVPNVFSIGFTTDAPYYRFKYTHDAHLCGSTYDYSQAYPSTQTPINFTLDQALGMHVLCILGVESHLARITNAQLDHAKKVAIERITAHHVHAPNLQIKRSRFHGEFYYINWYHDLSVMDHYKVKYGPYELTDCAQPEGYEEIPGFEVRHREYGPWEENYEHKAHPSNPELILIKQTKQQLESGVFSQRINSPRHTIKLCTLLFNLQQVPSPAREDILKPL